MGKAEMWSNICEIHQITKGLTIKAEEYDPQFRKNLQPVNELKNAYEHIIRVQMAEMGLVEEKDIAEYINANLSSALGHECRAFFDTADWLAMSLREKILKALNEYAPTVISKAIPTYYSEIRPRINDINDEIAKLRDAKDVGNLQALTMVHHYKDILDELFRYYTSIIRCAPALAEFAIEAERDKKDNRSLNWKSCVVGVLATVIFGLLFYLLTVFPSLIASVNVKK